MRKLTSIHDKFIRSKLSNLEVAKSFFHHHLPAAIKDKIDFNTLKLCSSSFVEPELKNSLADILYTVKFDGRDLYLYLLIEHQSRSVKLMPFRLYQYTLNVMQAHLNRTKSDTLPLVYSMIFYTGQTPYKHSNDIFDLFEDKELAKQLVFQPFQLIDLTQIPDEELQQHQRASLMELAAKHIFDRDILPFILSAQHIMQALDRSGYSEDICLVVEYIIKAGHGKEKNQIIDTVVESLSTEAKGKIMTIADQIKQEGRQEGLFQGKQEGRQEGRFEEKLEVAKKLLNKGSDINTISDLTDLPRNKIEELKQQVLC